MRHFISPCEMAGAGKLDAATAPAAVVAPLMNCRRFIVILPGMAVACNLGDQQVRRHQCAPLQRLRQRQSAPAVCAEPLERLESRLVGHLAATLDPVAKVDMGRLRLLCCLSQRKNTKGAEQASGPWWFDEAV